MEKGAMGPGLLQCRRALNGRMSMSGTGFSKISFRQVKKSRPARCRRGLLILVLLLLHRRMPISFLVESERRKHFSIDCACSRCWLWLELLGQVRVHLCRQA